MSTLLDDTRFALRTFRKHPGFATFVVLTLGVGIAAATLIFGIVNSVLYAKYAVYPDPGRMVFVFELNRKMGASAGASDRALSEWKAAATSLERMAGVERRTLPLSGGAGEPESVVAGVVTEGLFEVLGGVTVVGRGFAPEDYRPGAAPVALVSHDLWQARFAGRGDIVGQAITVDGRETTVAGVLARGFSLAPFFGRSPAVYLPRPLGLSADRSLRTMLVVARLRPGATTERARAELTALAERAEREDPAAHGWGIYMQNPGEFDPQGDAQFLIVLGVGVAFVLMIVCANIVSLLLTRAAGRAREVATRLALGAGRWRIARQFLTESLVLGVAGGVVGLFLTYWACRGLNWFVSGSNLHLDLGVNARVLAFAGVVSALMTAGVALFPSLRAARLPLIEALKERQALWGRVSGGRLRGLLVGVQVALAVVLLAGAGLVLHGVSNLWHNDAGIEPDGLLTLRLTLAEGRYPEPEAKAGFVEQAIERLAALPGVSSVSASSMLPAIGGEPPVKPVLVEGRANDDRSSPSAGLLAVSEGYFRTLGIPLVRGRALLASDRHGALPVAVVSEGFAERWLGGREPIGARVELEGTMRTVVGVARDVRNFHRNVAPRPAIYVPFSQRPAPGVSFVLQARNGDAASTISSAKGALRALDAEQPVRGGEAMRALMDQSMGGFATTSLLVVSLAAIALALAAIGIYGVVAYSVARRTREIGVRMALGAAPQVVVRQVVGEGLRRALYGGVPGLLLAAAVGRLLSSKLYEVAPLDPAVFGVVVLLVTLIVAFASWLPARRAASIDPAAATRSE